MPISGQCPCLGGIPFPNSNQNLVTSPSDSDDHLQAGDHISQPSPLRSHVPAEMESCGSDVHLQLPSDYVFTAVLAESAHGVLARGRRISDGQFVLLKTCDSRWRLERAASVLRHLAGSGACHTAHF